MRERQSNAFPFNRNLRSLPNDNFDAIVIVFFIGGFIVSPGICTAFLTFGYAFSSFYIILCTMIIPLIAFAIIFLADTFHKRRLVKSGAFTFFLFYFFFNLFAPLVLEPLVTTIENINLRNFTNTLVQDVCEILIIVFTFGFSKPLRQRFVFSIQSRYSILLSVAIVGVVVTNLVSLLFTQINNAFNNVGSVLNFNSDSSNQNAINSVLQQPLGALAIIPLTIAIAPLCEELAVRNGVFQMIKNRPLAAVVSIFYFANMHVTTQVDQILLYLGASIVFTLIFISSNYNVAYSFYTHSLGNTITTIAIIAFAFSQYGLIVLIIALAYIIV